jgi:hypothetical protein
MRGIKMVDPSKIFIKRVNKNAIKPFTSPKNLHHQKKNLARTSWTLPLDFPIFNLCASLLKPHSSN